MLQKQDHSDLSTLPVVNCNEASYSERRAKKIRLINLVNLKPFLDENESGLVLLVKHKIKQWYSMVYENKFLFFSYVKCIFCNQIKKTSEKFLSLDYYLTNTYFIDKITRHKTGRLSSFVS
ncbi:MAG: hypothetical protein LBK29_00735 [Oscillospiraceae bacterium]|jgi:hypothetical protein|nr:hypothetical protein [Oscillospiraceae bacterium]